MIEYKIIFTGGYDDDIDSLTKELKCDVLIMDESGKYYAPQFITLARISGEFDNHKVCYLEDNLVILHQITKDTILESIPHLHKWMFYTRWVPLEKCRLEKYFYPVDSWRTFSVMVE